VPESNGTHRTIPLIPPREIIKEKTQWKKLRGSEHAEEEIVSEIVSEIASEEDELFKNERRSKRLLRKISLGF
jgi:hypothetical protein